MTKSTLCSMFLVAFVPTYSAPESAGERAAVLIRADGQDKALRQALSDIRLYSHPRYRLVLDKKDVQGGLVSRVAGAARVNESTNEVRLEPTGSETIETLEARLKAIGLTGYRKELVPGQLEVHVPRQFEGMYTWRLAEFSESQTPKPPCPDCMGSGESNGPLAPLPRAPGDSGPLRFNRDALTIARAQTFVSKYYTANSEPVTVTPRTDHLFVAEVGPVRNHILNKQKMCEMISLSVSVSTTATTVTTIVAADGRFKNRDDALMCPTLAGQYTSHGTEFKAEEDAYAQRLARAITQHLGQ